jgi:16S rRNA (cytosine967-C5)-methyltransferase
MAENPVSHPFFAQGKYVIQDIHAARAAVLLDVQPGMKVLDACAAPGTKTQELAMFMNNEGQVISCDLYPQRAALIQQLMARTGVTIADVQVKDASLEGQFAEGSFDRILLDVPCSGLGDLKHKPEIRWHVQPQDLDQITKIQKRILHANAAYLKTGGILVYSTCTLNRKENEGMIQWFLKEHPGFVREEERTYFPFEDDGDGFYAAKLRKREREIMVE